MSKSYIDDEEVMHHAQELILDLEHLYDDVKIDEGTFAYLLSEVNKFNFFTPADVKPVPAGGIGEMSDGYHTFNGLYYQRMILFAALVKAYKDRAWKSYKHEDGELCFGGGWFIVGIDTPAGSYTYHYENKHFDLFECKELPVGKHWDGHTEKDVTRLLKLEPADVKPVVMGEWKTHKNIDGLKLTYCSVCGWTKHIKDERRYDICPCCGADMRKEEEDE